MSDRVANTVMVPSYQYDELQKICHENWLAKNRAERKASAYKALLIEALEVLPGRGSLRRRIIQTTGRDK